MIRRESPKIPLAFLLLLTVLGSALAFLPPPTFASVGCGTTIWANTNLAANIGPCSGNALVMGHSGITLNCAGHTVNGEGTHVGITLAGRTRVTVENCIVAGFQYGIRLSNSSGNTFIGDKANSNLIGFYLSGSSHNTLMGDAASGNSGYGFFLYSSSNENVLNASAANANVNGIMVRSSFGNIISGNTANANVNGIELLHSSNNTIIKDVSHFNSGNGFELDYCNNNNLTKDTARINAIIGFYVYDSSGNRLIGDTSNGNGVYGYYDTSTGSGTAGTANFYSSDAGSNNGVQQQRLL